MTQNHLPQFIEKMSAAKISSGAMKLFEIFYNKLLTGEKGLIPGTEALPVNGLKAISELEKYKEDGASALDKTVVIKLNGGLGTSMGLQGAKSLLKVKNDLRFIDIIVSQNIYLKKLYKTRTPLLFMNSFKTEKETAAVLAEHDELEQDIPISFFENKVPKVMKDTLEPAKWDADPSHEWAPPGHGDIYAALESTGIIDELLEKGYKYAFVSNADNLGATGDPRLAGYMQATNIPFLMEVTRRTVNDKKGGHLAKTPNGQLILREAAQCPPEEEADFQDIEKYQYFNTNNIWINLEACKKLLNEKGGFFELPMIVNEKNIDPTDPNSPKVYQLESAMGSAIGIFEGAEAVCVDRDRFIPVKKTSDLLILGSDLYEIQPDYSLECQVALDMIPEVKLDDKFYKFINDMSARFPKGYPSLIDCSRLAITGDFLFGANIVIEGDIELVNEEEEQMEIPDNTYIGPSECGCGDEGCKCGGSCGCGGHNH